jgi:hypothetical protein
VIRGWWDGKSGNVLVRDCDLVREPPARTAAAPSAPTAAGPRSPLPEGPGADPERQAAQKLVFAQQLAWDGSAGKARKWCEGIIRGYAGTNSAAEAEDLLRKLE